MSESFAQHRPVLRMAISATATDDRDRLEQALHEIAQQDPSVSIEPEPVSGDTIIRGMSEPHLEGICLRLSKTDRIPIDRGELQVIYLEALRRKAEGEGRYVRQASGAGNYGHVKILLEPNKPGQGFEFFNAVKGGVVPREYVQPTEQGIRAALQGGIIAGFEVADAKATLLDGSYHDLNSNEMAFRIAGSIACKEAMRKASPVLLEPIMAVAVSVGEAYLGTIIADLNNRRGRIEAIEQQFDSQTIKATVPLSEMFGYARYLQSTTQGRADYSIHFAQYEQAPPRGEWGDDGPHVRSLDPRRPRGSSGRALARMDEYFE